MNVIAVYNANVLSSLSAHTSCIERDESGISLKDAK
jgi:hypothetical protein